MESHEITSPGQPTSVRNVVRHGTLLLVLPALSFCCASAFGDDAKHNRSDAVQSRRRAIEYLLSQQAADGGFHSETYGALRDGAAITALVMYAVCDDSQALTDDDRHQLNRAYGFLRPSITRKGFVANPDGTLDYPTYASAMVRVAAARMPVLRIAKDELRRLDDFLAESQLTESLDCPADSPDYGGWDFWGATDRPAKAMDSNVSVTRFALEALQYQDGERTAPLARRARDWAQRCQNRAGDGGFYFHPRYAHFGNKAAWRDQENKQPRSYGTATSDGLLCLLYCGAKEGDPDLKSAVDWLKKHDDLELVPGFKDVTPNAGWDQGLRFYYYASMAKTLHLLPQKTAMLRATRLQTILVKSQRRDGRWQNDSARMREDDPLIATCLAVVALGDLQRLAAAPPAGQKTQTPKR